MLAGVMYRYWKCVYFKYSIYVVIRILLSSEISEKLAGL